MIFKFKNKEVNYLNKSFNKVFLNFVEIEIAYAKQNIFFSLKL